MSIFIFIWKCFKAVNAKGHKSGSLQAKSVHTQMCFAHFSVFYDVEPTFKNWENTHKKRISSVALHFCISDDSVSTFPPQLELHSEVAPVQGRPAMLLLPPTCFSYLFHPLSGPRETMDWCLLSDLKPLKFACIYRWMHLLRAHICM